jgi:hypothetical protein
VDRARRRSFPAGAHITRYGESAMMRKALMTGALVLLIPAAASAQIAVGARIGTLGVGAEASFRLNDRIAIRGGYGVVPYELEQEVGDVKYNVEPTSQLPNIGVDLRLGMIRFGGGLMFFQDSTMLEGTPTGTVTFGGTQYSGSQIGTVNGSLDHGSAVPYGIIGFGNPSGTGFGMFLDLGAAFTKKPDLQVTASGPIASNAQFRADLEEERQKIQDSLDKYFKVWPIISLGFRFGF